MNNHEEQLRRLRENSITPPPISPTIGQSRIHTASVGQINAARRRNALKQVRELIKEHQFSREEIEGR